MLKAETIAIFISRRARLAVLVAAMVLLIKSLAMAVAPSDFSSLTQTGVEIPARPVSERVTCPDK